MAMSYIGNVLWGGKSFDENYNEIFLGIIFGNNNRVNDIFKKRKKNKILIVKRDCKKREEIREN